MNPSEKTGSFPMYINIEMEREKALTAEVKTLFEFSLWRSCARNTARSTSLRTLKS